MKNKKIKTERRKFFSLLGKGVLGISLLSTFPAKLLGRSLGKPDMVKVKIHPSAIKRTR